MGRPRRPHFTETKPEIAPVVVTVFSKLLYQTALRIAKDPKKIRVISAGRMEIVDLPRPVFEKLRREHADDVS